MADDTLYFNQLFSAMSAGAAVYKPVDGGADFEFVDLNPAGERICGVTRAEVIGRRVTACFPGCREMGLIEALQAVQQSGEAVLIQDKQYRDDRLSFSVEYNAFRLGDGLLGVVFEDISGRQAMLRSMAQADRLSSMGLLAAGLAHEINNPLSYVLFNLDNLIEDLPAVTDQLIAARSHDEVADTVSDLRDQLEEALAGTRRIREIARSLSTFSRGQSEKTAEVDLNAVVQEAATMAYNEIKYRAQVDWQLGQISPLMACEEQLAHVFLNLLVNAAQAIEAGDAEHNRIVVSTEEAEGQIRVEIADTGCGIQAEQLERIFDPGYTTRGQSGGAGMGLSICKSIVEQAGGTIEAWSEPGRGARFLVSLPTHAGARSDRARTDPERPTAGRGGRVLVIDDEEGVRSAVRRMLIGQHQVELADSGEQAKQIIETDQGFDAILCDVMMPRVTGVDFYHWLRERHPALADRLVFITGGAFSADVRERLLEIEAPRIEKPFDIFELQKLVQDSVSAK